jgi:hypothetical protein
MILTTILLATGMALLGSLANANPSEKYNTEKCSTSSADAFGNTDSCKAQVCVTADPGYCFDDTTATVAVENNQGVGSGCGGAQPVGWSKVPGTPFKCLTKMCASMWAQSHGGSFGSPGHIRCGLHVWQYPV